ncbi:hypothetical protein PCC7424_4812 [Gloeothece citriformis PCC 7424]|uniref:Uncharacterized protein n=1 Tax=Gloeothece citriformis (strain PCC 7424) TaxID=65393 RepID=B7KD48_GLOC7|nr:hypothetical protein [Gloeothece citriformis]ACK73169.1 hypothetical protein PCC7424_4812 [Gloeothece citriformis PCC 7424]
MLEPSSIRHPEGYNRKIKEVKPGLYVVENAYEGEYVYFEKDSFSSAQNEQSSEEDLTGIGQKLRQQLGTDKTAPTSSTQYQTSSDKIDISKINVKP